MPPSRTWSNKIMSTRPELHRGSSSEGWGYSIVQSAKWWLSMHKTLASNQYCIKLGIVHNTYNPRIPLVQAGGVGVQHYPSLHSKFKSGLVHMRPCLKRTGGSGGNLVDMPWGAKVDPWNPCEKLSIDAHAYNFSTVEAEKGGSLRLAQQAASPDLQVSIPNKMASTRIIPGPDLWPPHVCICAYMSTNMNKYSPHSTYIHKIRLRFPHAYRWLSSFPFPLKSYKYKNNKKYLEQMLKKQKTANRDMFL